MSSSTHRSYPERHTPKGVLPRKPPSKPTRKPRRARSHSQRQAPDGGRARSVAFRGAGGSAPRPARWRQRSGQQGGGPPRRSPACNAAPFGCASAAWRGPRMQVSPTRRLAALASRPHTQGGALRRSGPQPHYEVTEPVHCADQRAPDGSMSIDPGAPATQRSRQPDC